jgi:predicted hydrocarbon binding protein
VVEQALKVQHLSWTWVFDERFKKLRWFTVGVADVDKTNDVGVKAERKPVDQGLRNFLKAIAAGGVGTALFGAGYLIGRRSLEEEFRQKFTEKIEQILQLEQVVNDLTLEKKDLRTRLEQLSSDYNRVKSEYDMAKDFISLSDLLEIETVRALSLYRIDRTKQLQAINELYAIVAKYAKELGADRVQAEKMTADILSSELDQKIKLEQTVLNLQKKLESLNRKIDELSNSWWSEVPLNPEGDFSEGGKYWGAGQGGELRNAKWGYEIKPREYGEIWLDNPNIDNWPNAALYQGTVGLHSSETWYLKNKHFMLEADAMVVEDKPYDPRGWSRVAIVIMIKRIDGRDYNIRGRITPFLYTEYDIYRRNFPWDGYRDWKDLPTDVYEYHADQLPFGYWKPYKIDVTEFLQNGYNGIGGWGSEIYNISRIHAWYLVVENTAAKTTARWRKVKIYQVKERTLS